MNRTAHTGKRANCKAGFTLTELMVTMGIIGTISATAFINVAREAPEIEDERATGDLIAKVRECRLEAVTQNRPVEWWIDDGDIQLWADENGDGFEDTSEVRTLELDNRGWYSTYPNRNTFDSRGQVVMDSYPGVLIWSYQKTKVDFLTVSQNGHVRIHDTY